VKPEKYLRNRCRQTTCLFAAYPEKFTIIVQKYLFEPNRLFVYTKERILIGFYVLGADQKGKTAHFISAGFL